MWSSPNASLRFPELRPARVGSTSAVDDEISSLAKHVLERIPAPRRGRPSSGPSPAQGSGPSPPPRQARRTRARVVRQTAAARPSNSAAPRRSGDRGRPAIPEPGLAPPAMHRRIAWFARAQSATRSVRALAVARTTSSPGAFARRLAKARCACPPGASRRRSGADPEMIGALGDRAVSGAELAQ